jgi:hypothetical protein
MIAAARDRLGRAGEITMSTIEVLENALQSSLSSEELKPQYLVVMDMVRGEILTVDCPWKISSLNIYFLETDLRHYRLIYLNYKNPPLNGHNFLDPVNNLGPRRHSLGPSAPKLLLHTVWCGWLGKRAREVRDVDN